MPTCQQTMSVTRNGPFTRGSSSSPSATSSHQRGSAPRRRSPSASTASVMRSISSSVYGRISVSSYLPDASAFSRSPRIISRYWAARGGPSCWQKTSAVHSCTARPANSPALSWTPTRALRRAIRAPGYSGLPPLAVAP